MELFEIKPIKNEEGYQKALVSAEKLWSAKKNTDEGDQLELLLMTIDAYEAEHYPIPKLNPIDAIKYRMEENDLNQVDLVKYFGTKSRVSEVLNGKKQLTLKMAKSLYNDFGIPAESLLAY